MFYRISSQFLVAAIGSVFCLASCSLNVAPPPTKPPVHATLLREDMPTKLSFEKIDNAQLSGLTLFRVKENPLVHVLDYQSLHLMGQALNRIGVLVEWREAPKDRIVTDKALAKLAASASISPDTLFFGHDYRARDLARFFNLARQSQFALNETERKLLGLALQESFIRDTPEGYRIEQPEKVLIAIPQVQGDIRHTPQDETVSWPMRGIILSHELGHGEFFTNPAYAQYCRTFWRTALSATQRKAFTRFLAAAQHYDIHNEELIINEFQAYLAYSGVDGSFFGYNVVPAITAKKMARLREQFIAHSPARIRPFAETWNLKEIARRTPTHRP